MIRETTLGVLWTFLNRRPQVRLLSGALTRSSVIEGEWGLNHDLRHFLISELFRSGVPAHVVRSLTRHSDLQTTQRYADLDATDLRAAIDRLDVSRDPGNVATLTMGSV